QITNSKQIKMTKIKNSKPPFVFGYLPCGISPLANLPKAGFHRVKIWDFIGIWCLEFDILQCSVTPLL
ncbi:MAG: hypothetical protein PVG97_10435, partial [Syntrophobacterales bacterium]